LRLVAAAAAAIGLISGLPGAAQEGGQPRRRAVLVSGPIPVKGIPVYAPNRVPAFRGTYSLEQAPGEQPRQPARTLTVLYTRQSLFIPRDWIPRLCGERRLYQVTDYETFALGYTDERGFFLFFIFTETGEPADWCAFAGPFIERFLFLYNFVDSTEAPFPAILDMGES
jgi:hypothetical protein